MLLPCVIIKCLSQMAWFKKVYQYTSFRKRSYYCHEHHQPRYVVHYMSSMASSVSGCYSSSGIATTCCGRSTQYNTVSCILSPSEYELYVLIQHRPWLMSVSGGWLWLMLCCSNSYHRLAGSRFGSWLNVYTRKWQLVVSVWCPYGAFSVTNYFFQYTLT